MKVNPSNFVGKPKRIYFVEGDYVFRVEISSIDGGNVYYQNSEKANKIRNAGKSFIWILTCGDCVSGEVEFFDSAEAAVEYEISQAAS